MEDDLHNRIARAVQDKIIKSFDMRESSLPGDGDQDLTMFMREVGGSCFKGYQRYKFEAEFDDADGERLCGGRPVQALPSR